MLEMNTAYNWKDKIIVAHDNDSQKTYFLNYTQEENCEGIFSFSILTKNIMEENGKIEFKKGTRYFGVGVGIHDDSFNHLKNIYLKAAKKLEQKVN